MDIHGSSSTFKPFQSAKLIISGLGDMFWGVGCLGGLGSRNWLNGTFWAGKKNKVLWKATRESGGWICWGHLEETFWAGALLVLLPFAIHGSHVPCSKPWPETLLDCVLEGLPQSDNGLSYHMLSISKDESSLKDTFSLSNNSILNYYIWSISGIIIVASWLFQQLIQLWFFQ